MLNVKLTTRKIIAVNVFVLLYYPDEAPRCLPPMGDYLGVSTSHFSEQFSVGNRGQTFCHIFLLPIIEVQERDQINEAVEMVK